MTPVVRSALTLGVLSIVLLGAASWGWRSLTHPFPKDEETPFCIDEQISAGERLFRDQVAVSVFNASRRNGLAGATMERLQRRGFVGADTGNVPEDADISVKRVQIWADDPSDPAVRLVKKQFRKAQVVEGEALGRGVVVVLGQKYRRLGKNKESVKVQEDTTVCVPTAPPEEPLPSEEQQPGDQPEEGQPEEGQPGEGQPGEGQQSDAA